MSTPEQAQNQQYVPPDPRQALVQQKSLQYQRAAQVASDAVYAFYNRLFSRASLHEFAVPVTAAIAPAIMQAVLADEDVLDPQPEE